MLANNPSVLTGGGVATNLVNGTGLFANGTAAAPSISFASDTGTGFYRSSAGIVAVTSSGVRGFEFLNAGSNARLRFNSPSGNVPYIDLVDAGQITVNAGGTNQNITLTPSGTGFAQIGSASGTLLLVGTGTNSSNGAIQLATHTTSAGGIGFGTDISLYRANATDLYTTATRIASSTAGNFYIGTQTNSQFVLQTNLTNCLIFDTAQNSIFYGIVIHKSYTVATLPAAAANNTYGTTFVSDATQLAGVGIGTAPTGGGAVKRAVYSTGGGWLLL